MKAMLGGTTPNTSNSENEGRGGHVPPEPGGLDTKYIKGGGSSMVPDEISQGADDWSNAGAKVETASKDLLSSITTVMSNQWTGDLANQMLTSTNTFSTSGVPIHQNATKMSNYLTATSQNFATTQSQIAANSDQGHSAGEILGDILTGSSPFDERERAQEEQRRLNEIVQGVHNPSAEAINNHKVGDVKLHTPVIGTANLPGATSPGGTGGTGNTGGGGAPSPGGVNVPKTNLKVNAPAKTNTPNAGAPSTGAGTPKTPDLGAGANKTGAPGALDPGSKKNLKTKLAGLGGGKVGGGKGGGGGGGGLGAAANAAKAARPTGLAGANPANAANAAKLARAGSPGAGGPMAGRGAASKSADGKEHKAADYLVSEKNTEEIIGEAPTTAPPVINE
ncbi:hypothetical protein [Gordonia crocea]|uniref:hypothetical protein n=1 Tax=Gordonia crocea TaxID=589162 RepID=UPI00137A2677|nr:hypothetical protein [Gordonia crocea]